MPKKSAKVTRHQPRPKPNLCPSCHEPLVITKRGAEWFAYCPGPHGYDGCTGMGEFGETEDEAIDSLYEIQSLIDL